MKTIFVKRTMRRIAGTLAERTPQWKNALYLGAFLGGMFLMGAVAANGLKMKEAEVIQQANITTVIKQTENWGLGFGKKEGEKPKGNATIEELQRYDAYYRRDTEDKVIYLTFDCGYENGNTKELLKALKKHKAPATFFVVGHFLQSAPELAKQMIEEGHTVGNHTYHHPDMSKIATKENFEKEMREVEQLFYDITGTELAKYYRPPQGKYSTDNLQMAKELGYRTFFWSLAYVDWKVDEQPDCEAAIVKLTKRIHPGAIVLLHSTSQTNAQILDTLLTKWEEMGYRFGALSDFGSGDT